ncbi:MAG: DNA methyltransferase, partial [Bryobacterales bacterium]|nr:DNA methyltransferase [Bryobacterales bacterium]
GNPPYHGFAGMAVDEERELSEAYRTTKEVRKPEGQGLNDLYVRFFRMAERRIAEKTGQGVVCFISNYSWLDGLSFTGMRERYLEAFDAIRIDCLNGDKYKTGKVAPDGSPDPSIFSTKGDPIGIQVGTAIATLVRKRDHKPSESLGFRHLWGQAKPEELLATAEAEPAMLYSEVRPSLPLGLAFAETAASADWFEWPALPDLLPVSFPGVKTSRDGFLVDTDLDRLRARVGEYFDPARSHEEIARRYPKVMGSTARFDARAVRDALVKRGGPDEAGFIRFAYRPFDNRWLYWERDTKLLDEKRTEYRAHVCEGNMWLEAREREPTEEFARGTLVGDLADNFGNGLSSWFPSWLHDGGLASDIENERRANLTDQADRYLTRLGLGIEDLFHHTVTTLHDPAYREANADALRMGWPRIPLPGWPDGEAEGAAEALARSAAQGRCLAALLDSQTPVPGVTEAPLRPELAAIAVPATVGGRNMAGNDFAVTGGWGIRAGGDVVMPGRGRIVERDCTPGESALGDKTLDVHLNAEAFWRNVPTAVWSYRLGGYQVLKKWLSYRERRVLGRNLRAAEVQHFTDTARRIGALLIATSNKPDRSST